MKTNKFLWVALLLGVLVGFFAIFSVQVSAINEHNDFRIEHTNNHGKEKSISSYRDSSKNIRGTHYYLKKYSTKKVRNNFIISCDVDNKLQKINNYSYYNPLVLKTIVKGIGEINFLDISNGVKGLVKTGNVLLNTNKAVLDDDDEESYDGSEESEVEGNSEDIFSNKDNFTSSNSYDKRFDDSRKNFYFVESLFDLSDIDVSDKEDDDYHLIPEWHGADMVEDEIFND